MTKLLRNALLNVPTPIAGLALGIASLGLCLESRFPHQGQWQAVGAITALLLLSALFAKFALHRHLLQQDLKHPVVGSVLPTFTMALMIVTQWIAGFNEYVAVGLWYIAIALHLILLMVFMHYRLQERQWQLMVPSWFVPPVGIIMAAVSCPGAEHLALAKALVLFGISNYAVLLAPMLYRLIFHPEVPDAAKPTIAILAAPASLALVGYLNIAQQPNVLLIALLLGIAMCMTALVYVAFLKLMRLPFSPAYAAFTFPMVIGATAIYRCAALFEHFEAIDASWLYYLADFELAIACTVVAYVALRYVHALLFHKHYRLFAVV